MDDGFDSPKPQEGSRIETADGQKVFLFRYENPSSVNNAPNSAVSQEAIVGGWFTDSIINLKDYIKKKKPGGNIKVVEIPKDKLDELKAVNHPIAKDMDIEPFDNYIIPEDLQETAQVFPLDITPKNPNKFLFGDWKSVDQSVDNIVSNLQEVKV